ncbi:MAG: flagellar hook capping FlgD N-terminal domain-containing protein [Pseudomonadota bacterium]
MDIDLSSALASLNNSDTATSRSSITDNFDTFLQLLTTQLQNQNPTEPIDTNEFTQQLVQFTEVEQSLKSNENLEILAQLSAANTIIGSVSYIGKTVTLDGKTAQLNNGSASWAYSSPEVGNDATFTIKDKSGNTIYTEKRNITEGASEFKWNGRTTEGTFAPNGDYTLSIDARNSQGGTIDVSTSASGTVDGVDMSGSEPVLLVNGREVKMGDVISVRQQSVSEES